MATRRRFLGCTGGALLSLPAMLAPLAAGAANDTILVAILLAGGCDALNTVVPLQQYGLYKQLRTPTVAGVDPRAVVALSLPSLAATAFDSNPATPPSSASTFAFHPAMTALRAVYAGGHLAVINGIGIPSDDAARLSHEVGQFDWQSGTMNGLGASIAGWLGTAFDTLAPGAGAMVSMIGQTPVLMTGRSARPLVLGVPLESFAFATGSADSADAGARANAFANLAATPEAIAEAEAMRAIASSASGAVARIQALASANPANDYPAPRDFLSLQLKQIARLITGNIGARAYYAIQGGYDTHADQQNDHPRLVGALSEGLANFYAYLKAKNASRNVVIMTFSDFGRRPGSNDSNGTDHGTAQSTFVLGDAVRGGTYGQMPSLSALDDDGNVSVAVDFRNQLSDIIRVMGADPNAILGRGYAPLGFL